MATPAQMRNRAPRSRGNLFQLAGGRSLLSKLLLPFLGVTLLSLGAVTFFGSRVIQDRLTQQLGENYKLQATAHAKSVGEILDRQLQTMQAFGLSKLMQDELSQRGDAYTGDQAAIEAEIQRLDQQWTDASDTDPLVQERLENETATELEELHTLFPAYAEVFVTDKYGALIAATDRTSDYAQADEEWWQTAYNNGKGATYIGQPEIDDSTQMFSMNIAVPVFGHNEGEVVGVMRTTYKLDEILNVVKAFRLGETGHAELLLPNGEVFETEDGGTLEQAAPERVAALDASKDLPYAEIAFEGVPQFVSQAPITGLNAGSAVNTIGWRFFIEQDTAEAFAPVNNATRTMLLTALPALLGTALVAYFIARAISKPIQQLTQTARQIAAGDLSRRVPSQRSDEIGQLASSFNTMTQSLEDRVAAEQQAQAQAQQLQRAEKENRQRLEQAVDEYLGFVQQVANGNLQQRLHVDYDGVLGQLGQGLNGMVANLRTMTQQVQEASMAIASSASEILASTSQQAASAAEQSAAITQTTTTVEEVKVIAQQTAQQANQLAQQGHQVLDAAHQGTQAVDQTVDGMGLIRERVDSIANTILALSEQTAAIGEITQTVTDLADQSNLLALNAAIEAARAGEQGKGFAVVAQHVRELAERSKGATAQVREILNEVQRATSTAVMVTEEGTKGVTQGAELAGRAGHVIMRMAREVETGAQANMQVAAAAQQQTAGMDQIGQAMGAIQQATTETLSSTRQAERAAKDLASLAQSLQQAVAAYQV